MRYQKLESKKADQYSLTIKTKVWKDIHQEFIAQLDTERDVLRLKEQWQRMKKQARAELQDYKVRVKKHGEQVAQLRKVSNISEQVLKIMDVVYKNNQEEDDVSCSSSETSEQDNIPTYFCETEVKQEQDDEMDLDNEIRNKFCPALSQDSEGSLSSITAVLNNYTQSKMKFNTKRDTIFTLLANICNQNGLQNDIHDNVPKKRKVEEFEEFQFLQSLFESKHKEHQKRMQIIDEQLKTAKLHRETAEIQKQIAQQELKQVLLQSTNAQIKDKQNSVNINGPNLHLLNDRDMFDVNMQVKHDMLQKITFHQNQITLHNEEIEKCRQQVEEIIKREH